VRPALLTFSLACVLAASTPAPPAPPATFRNGAFHEGELGKLPLGWLLPRPSEDAGFRCELVEDSTLPGKRCALLRRESPSARGVGNLMQSVDATPYRGKRIRLNGQLRLESKETTGAAQMWLRVDRAGKKMGFFDNMQERPVRTATWTPVEIIGDVAPDAERLALGTMLLNGGDKVWIAPMTLEVLGDTPAARLEGPKALTPQGLRNLEAFTRALNYVRFFQPSDEGARADWARLASEGVRAVEGAASTPQLAQRLQTFFAPYAPSAQFLIADQKPRVPAPPPDAALAVRWSHIGFGQNQSQPTYRSTREFIPLAERAAKGWADPQAATTLKLSSEVRLWLPSVAYADADRKTLPKAPAPSSARITGLPEPTAGASGSGADRAVRLGDVALAWGIFQHFYPYFDVVKTDWNAELSKALRGAAQDKDSEAFTHTLRRLTAPLKDGHVHVFHPETQRQAIPLEVQMVEGQPVVLRAPVSVKDLLAGSRILAVDGEPSAQRLARLKSEISAATEGWMNVRLAQEFLAGDLGTEVKLAYCTPGGQRGETTLTRNWNYWEPQDAGKPAKVAELKPGIWYVDLDRTTDKDFEAALPKLAAARGVVFDLRGYPKMGPSFLQHLTDRPLESARWNKPIVTQPDGKGWTWDTSGRWNLEPNSPRIKGRVVFLTGGGAISYAESCMGIVEAYHLAEIVGEPTAGTNGNINPFQLPGGYDISWTGMKVVKHDGTPHHGVGIRPTELVIPTIQGISAGRDEVLERGIEVASR